MIFGSIGWGLLHGVLVLVTIAVSAALLAAGIPPRRIGLAMLTGFAAGLAVAIILGSGLSNLLWKVVGDALLPLAAADARPLAAALVVLPIVVGILGGLLGLFSGALGNEPREPFTPPTVSGRILAGLPAAIYIGWLAAFGVAYSQAIAWFDWRLVGAIVAGIVVVLVIAAVIGRWRAGLGVLTGFSIGAAIGVVVGAFTAVAFHWRVGIAIGFTVGLATTLAMLALEATHIKVDEESLKARFYPSRTIEMTKETIEWARERMPLSRKS